MSTSMGWVVVVWFVGHFGVVNLPGKEKMMEPDCDSGVLHQFFLKRKEFGGWFMDGWIVC